MEAGKEEAEWWRVVHLEAWVANRLRFSRDDPVVHPKDINPLYKRPKVERKSMAEVMAGFWAAHPNMPIQRHDGTIVDGIGKDEGKV